MGSLPPSPAVLIDPAFSDREATPKPSSLTVHYTQAVTGSPSAIKTKPMSSSLPPKSAAQPDASCTVNTEPMSSSLPPKLAAQPDAADTEATRASSRKKKPTRFFGDPLRNSIETIEEHRETLVNTPSPRKRNELIRHCPYTILKKTVSAISQKGKYQQKE